MFRASPSASLVGHVRRVLALGCAGLVLALTVFAASPAAHEWLHVDAKHSNCGHAHKSTPVTAETHDCAVVLFASGVSLPVGPVAVIPPLEAVQSVSPVTAAEVFLVSPRYLRRPERGPPANWVS